MRYEDLKKDTAKEVVRMLDFLGVKYTSVDDIRQRICQDFTEFRRHHTKEDDFDHYSHEQREYIASILKEVITASKLTNKTHILRAEEYLT